MKAKRTTAPRLKRGRPRKDADDQIVVDMAGALMDVYALGQQEARDLALALLEGQQATPTKTPRKIPHGARWVAVPPYMLVLGYELPQGLRPKKPRFEGRAKTIRGKHLKPRDDVVEELAELLRALLRKDSAAILRAFIATRTP